VAWLARDEFGKRGLDFSVVGRLATTTPVQPRNVLLSDGLSLHLDCSQFAQAPLLYRSFVVLADSRVIYNDRYRCRE
jgi:hypothetical protein